MDYKNKPEVLEWARKHWMEASDVEKKHWEFVFPELAESEDEIRKGLIQHLQELSKCNYEGGSIPIKFPEHYKVWIEWLEKQKEQKFDGIKGGDIIVDEEYHRVFLVLANVDERNYQETYSTYCESLLLGVDGCVYCDDTDLKEYRIANYEERMQFLHELKVTTKIEQKPTDIKAELKNAYQKGWDAALLRLPKEVDSQIWQIANNSAKTWEESFAILNAAKRAFDKGKAEGLKEQKPLTTEETELNSIAFLEQLGYTCIPSGAKSAECSEDERIRKALIPVVDRLLGTIDFPFTEQQVLDWFEKQKNILGERAKWSEEDEIHKLHTIQLIEEVKEWGEKDGLHHFLVERSMESISWLKSLSPQPHWKPSKEQMKALNKVANEGALLDLFNDLLNLL